jgi:hypothetical protein
VVYAKDSIQDILRKELVAKMERLTKGTIEFLVIPVTDTQGNLTNIGAATYSLYTGDDAATQILTGVSCAVQGMTILPLINTTTLDEGPYDLFVTFSAPPETPKLGPFRFRVDD